MVKYEHLGGHLNKTHVDAGALRWLKNMGVSNLLDIGCSVGGQVACAIGLGLPAWGIEGDYTLLQEGLLETPTRILFSDFTKTWVAMPTVFDAIWCVEVAEHIEEEFTPNLLLTISENIKSKGILIFTANSGPGIHHVNKKPVEWWKEKLHHAGFNYSEELTKELRQVSTMEREFIKDTGMALIKKP